MVLGVLWSGRTCLYRNGRRELVVERKRERGERGDPDQMGLARGRGRGQDSARDPYKARRHTAKSIGDVGHTCRVT